MIVPAGVQNASGRSRATAYAMVGVMQGLLLRRHRYLLQHGVCIATPFTYRLDERSARH